MNAPANEPEDPLAQLAAAWRAIEPPNPTASVDAPDEATRATIGWMQAAWRASAPTLGASAPALPWRLRRRIAQQRVLRPVIRMVPWIAAAAALLLMVWFAAREHATSPIRLGRHAEVATQPRSEVPELPVDPPLAATPSGVPLVPVTISAERMELRSGNVRLILFTPSQESNR